MKQFLTAILASFLFFQNSYATTEQIQEEPIIITLWDTEDYPTITETGNDTVDFEQVLKLCDFTKTNYDTMIEKSLANIYYRYLPNLDVQIRIVLDSAGDCRLLSIENLGDEIYWGLDKKYLSIVISSTITTNEVYISDGQNEELTPLEEFDRVNLLISYLVDKTSEKYYWFSQKHSVNLSSLGQKHKYANGIEYTEITTENKPYTKFADNELVGIFRECDVTYTSKEHTSCSELYVLPSITPTMIDHPNIINDFNRLSPPETFSAVGDTCIQGILVIKKGTKVVEARSKNGNTFTRYVFLENGKLLLFVYNLKQTEEDKPKKKKIKTTRI